MPKKLTSTPYKPCKKCGTPVEGYPRPDHRGYNYSRHCPDCRGRLKGPAHPRWNGGFSVARNGYAYMQDPRVTDRRKLILVHRWLWEQAYGPLLPGQQIHHKNGQRADNRLENLELMGAYEHNQMHGHAQDMARVRSFKKKKTLIAT